MYYIEGPAIFESEEPNTFITSDSYILVKYLDSDRQKQTFFKEGVNKKFVKENSLKDFDACSRFKDEISCNDLKSYGLNNMKCNYINNKCISVPVSGSSTQL